MRQIPKLIVCTILSAFAAISASENALAFDFSTKIENSFAYSSGSSRCAPNPEEPRDNISDTKKSDPIKILPELSQRKLIDRSPDLYVSPEKLKTQLRERNELILIDVRNPDDFKKYKLHGSINLPLFAIKTKSFLKTKNSVLVDEGHRYSHLEQTCKSLRSSGYSVWILDGGLNSWRHQFGPLEGDIFAQKELSKISPGEFFSERHYKDWIIVDTSDKQSEESRTLIPYSCHIPFSKNADAFLSRILKINVESQGNPINSFLIINEDGSDYEEIETLLQQKARLIKFFFLEGGINQYKRFLENQVIIWQQKNHRKTSEKKCPSCP